jgi:hypothetical protein
MSKITKKRITKKIMMVTGMFKHIKAMTNNNCSTAIGKIALTLCGSIRKKTEE